MDAVIHNAGIYIDPERVATPEGHARTLAVNVLAPYLLTAEIERPARLIYISSDLHEGGDASLHDIDWTARRMGRQHRPTRTASSSSRRSPSALSRRWPDVRVNVVGPGWVPTRMGGPSAPDDLELGHTTQVWLAVSDEPDATGTGGYWYHQRRQAPAAAVSDAGSRTRCSRSWAGSPGSACPDDDRGRRSGWSIWRRALLIDVFVPGTKRSSGGRSARRFHASGTERAGVVRGGRRRGVTEDARGRTGPPRAPAGSARLSVPELLGRTASRDSRSRHHGTAPGRRWNAFVIAMPPSTAVPVRSGSWPKRCSCTRPPRASEQPGDHPGRGHCGAGQYPPEFSLVDALAYAIGIAVSPVAIGSIVLLLSRPTPLRVAAAFAAGWISGVGAQVVILATAVNSADITDTDPTALALAELTIGVCFLIATARIWQRRREPRPGGVARSARRRLDAPAHAGPGPVGRQPEGVGPLARRGDRDRGLELRDAEPGLAGRGARRDRLGRRAGAADGLRRCARSRPPAPVAVPGVARPPRDGSAAGHRARDQARSSCARVSPPSSDVSVAREPRTATYDRGSVSATESSHIGELVETKLMPPRARGDVIDRPRLTTELDDLRTTALTLIVAPVASARR